MRGWGGAARSGGESVSNHAATCCKFYRHHQTGDPLIFDISVAIIMAGLQPIVLIIGIAFLAILLLITLGVLVWYSGLLDDITVGAGKPPCRNLKVVYKFGRGAYKDVGAVFTEVTCLSPTSKCFGVYYDDPKQVPTHKLRWAVGCVLAEGHEDPDPVLLQSFTKEGFKCFHFPEVNNAVTASFPYRTQLSVFVGIYRVYPELARYIREMKLCAHPFVEVYAGDKIHYYAPLSKQEGFYVPESDPHYINPTLVAWDNTSATGASSSTEPSCAPVEGSSTIPDVRPPAKNKSTKVKEDGSGDSQRKSIVSEGEISVKKSEESTGVSVEGQKMRDDTHSKAVEVQVEQKSNTAHQKSPTTQDQNADKAKSFKSSSAPPFQSKHVHTKVEQVAKPISKVTVFEEDTNTNAKAPSERFNSEPKIQDSGITSTTRSLSKDVNSETSRRLSEISPSTSFSEDDDLALSVNSYASNSSYLSNSESQYSNLSMGSDVSPSSESYDESSFVFDTSGTISDGGGDTTRDGDSGRVLVELSSDSDGDVKAASLASCTDKQSEC